MTREREPTEEAPEELAEPAIIVLSQDIFGPVDDKGEPIDKSMPIDVEAAVARHASTEAQRAIDIAAGITVDEPDSAPVFHFVGHEAPQGGSVLLHFLCPNPGPNLGAVYDLTVPASDLDGLKSQDAFSAYVQPFLAAMVRPAEHPSADKLDGWLRGTVTI